MCAKSKPTGSLNSTEQIVQHLNIDRLTGLVCVVFQHIRMHEYMNDELGQLDCNVRYANTYEVEQNRQYTVIV